MSGIKKWFANIDGDQKAEWGLLAGAGLLSLFAQFFKKRHNDRIYEQKMGEEIEKQTAKLIAKKTEAE